MTADTMHLRVEKLLWRGRGLARLDSGQIVMIEPGVLPGEDVALRITKKAKDFLHAEAVDILVPSPLRQAHPCPHAGECGGSRFGVVSPENGTMLKTHILHDVTKRALGATAGAALLDGIRIAASPQSWRYRWRGQLHVQNGQPHAVGQGTNTLVPLSDCHLLADSLAQALPTLARELPNGRFTIAASPVTGQCAHENSDLELEFSFPAFGLTMHLPPGIFFQANWELNQILIDRVVTACSAVSRIADLFSGAGNFSLPLASQGKIVLAVEGEDSACRIGTRNAARLGLHTVRFENANLAKAQTWAMIRKFRPEILILDPPRTGAKGIGQTLLTIPGLRRLIWVSCDLVNTLRDVKPLLDAGWILRDATLFDMFPGTWHMEVLLVLDSPAKDS